MTLVTEESVRVDPGGVKGSVVVVVALATAAVMGLGVAVAWEILRSARTAEASLPAGRFGAPPADMNGIEMSLLVPGSPMAARRIGDEPRRHGAAERSANGSERAAERDGAPTESAAKRLSSYGWTDRASGRVHIPLGRAKELYLTREAGAAPARPVRVRAQARRAAAQAEPPSPEQPAAAGRTEPEAASPAPTQGPARSEAPATSGREHPAPPEPRDATQPSGPAPSDRGGRP